MSNLVEFRDYKVTFSKETGGFPEKISLKLRGNETQDVVVSKLPWLGITLGSGVKAYPCLPEGYEPKRQDLEDRVLLDYWNIPWRTETGEELEQWFLNLSYDFCADGVGFVRMFFTTVTLSLPDICGFKLTAPMNFRRLDDVTYGYWQRPADVTSSTIQAINSFVRNATEKVDKVFERTIVPLIGFDYGRLGKPSRHIEWMLEGQNSLSADHFNTRTALTWQDGSPVVEWEFADKLVSSQERPYQWRNQLGFVLGQTPKVRQKAPLRMYHHLDLYDRFPTEKQIEKMADEGANALILHEGWRTDMQNGGVPYNPDAFAQVVEVCHRRDIRIMPYIRGNEPSVREDLANWFNTILKKDYDGLYADYGGPVHYFYKDENYPGGRFAFKEHYLKMKELKEQTIGKDGLFVLHTGPFFSGSVLGSIIDGYTAGEGEKGIMLSSRRENAYFSESTMGPGALWTAAFPDYKTKKILPYMANLGQYPHVSLGVQIKSSSLAHPSEPGNVTFARPLWKLYGLMDKERNVQFSNDICYPGAIECDSDQTGAAVFGMEDGAQLIVISNFRDTEARYMVSVDFKALGIDTTGKNCSRMLVGLEGCDIIPCELKDEFKATLPAYGITGYLIYEQNEKWEKRINEFLKPYPQPEAEEKAYLESVEAMKKSRFEATPSRELYLKVRVPTIALNWEDDVWWDLYNSSYELYVTPEGGAKTLLGFVGKNGFTKVRPEGATILWPGKETPLIPLAEILPRGKSLVELRVNHLGEDFYSFIEATLYEDREGRMNPREIVYMSELDADRARLTFAVDLR